MVVNPHRGNQYARPVSVASLGDVTTAQPLNRVQLTPSADGAAFTYSEEWLQQLIHRHPSILPVAEIEPGLGTLIPVGMEVPTLAGGFLDNLFVTPEGNLVVVECKLWRNPEARRRVIAQVIDYAESMSTWGYDDLSRAISRSIGSDKKAVAKTLLEIVRTAEGVAGEVDEAGFIDAVHRNLRLGRMLLLIMGDGIRAGAESLTDFLQQHAGFHFTLGLVEAAVYELPDERLLVQARVLARTLNIERAVVKLLDGVAAAPSRGVADLINDGSRAVSLSEATYFERLNAADPPTASALEDFLTKAADVGVLLELATKSATLKWESPSGRLFSLGGINLQGRLSTYSVCWAPHAIGRVDIAHTYLAALAELAGAQVRRTATPENWYLVIEGTTLPAAAQVLRKPTEWVDLIIGDQQQIIEVEQKA